MLVVAVLLLAVGLMGVTALQLSRGQYQLAGNLQHQELAFAKAEATVAVAEKWLLSPANARSSSFNTYDSGTPGLYPAGKLAALGFDPKTMLWSASNSVAINEGQYLIERLARRVSLPGDSIQVGQASTGACRAVDLFRVVGNAASVRGGARLIEVVFATDGCY